MTGRREAQQAPRSVGFSPPSLLLLSGPLLGCIVGCGGGLPLLHPAQTLRLGDVRALAGFSSNVAVGELASATRNAVNEAAGNPNAPTPGDVTYAQGALVAASIGPGLAPIAGARVGVGAQSEAGLVYTGRAVRADIRHSFELSDTWALSVGAGGSAALYGRDEQSSVPNVDLGRLHGWGADVPVLIGYESDGDLYMLWMGARGGWEHVDVHALGDAILGRGSGRCGRWLSPCARRDGARRELRERDRRLRRHPRPRRGPDARPGRSALVALLIALCDDAATRV
jgi:hypothetical protein